MDDRRVVLAAEVLSYFAQRRISKVLAKIHGDLPRERDVPGPLLGLYVLKFESKIFAYRLLDILYSEGLLLIMYKVFKDVLCHVGGYELAGK
ncbi:hypothetical protein BMS3Abin09_01300 [bacterium BMS3Abin09]|nr:hypothetical protein BMS3Abin09_01300 [bacterium BMS3Abin09]